MNPFREIIYRLKSLEYYGTNSIRAHIIRKEVEKMSLLSEQYSNSKKFMARIELHRRFRTNPYPWTLWVFDQIKFPKNAKVLELGSGNALLWKSNLKRIPEDAQILLTDFSEGMLEDAHKILGNDSKRFEYGILDAQEISYPDDSFDIVIANLMLYHIPDRVKAISEISRVLKPEGALYASTYSWNNMKEFTDLLKDYDKTLYNPIEPFARAFGLENGAEQLSKSFEEAEIINYIDSLEVTESKPIVDYMLSFGSIKENIDANIINGFKGYIDDILRRDGVIKISKDTGIFIAKKPK
jgi:ubiquinone/menaquinone biosynthesis C-methylase UbiE